MMFARLRQSLTPTMQYAQQRLDARGVAGVNGVFALALLVALSGVLLAWAGGYHAGFICLNKVSNGLLPDSIWAWITRLGDERVLVLLSLLFARRRPEVFWAMIVAAIFAALYSRGLKNAVDALRPPAVLALQQIELIGPALRGHSFPSGHTTSIFVFCGVLFAFAGTWQERLALLCLAGVVGLSRVALGVHWPQDVLAGAFGGLFAAALGVWLSYHWRAGLKPAVHLWLMLLPLLAAISLVNADNGNPATPLLIYPLLFAMLAQALLDYGVYRR